jgi:hypothetical protein
LESGREFVLSVLLSVSIGSKGDPSGTQLKSFQMVSLLPDGVFNRRGKKKKAIEHKHPNAGEGPVTLFLPGLWDAECFCWL